MVKSELAEAKQKKKLGGPKKWFLETRSELKKVSWPTKKQTLINTFEVFATIAFFGVIVWVSDPCLLQLTKILLRQTSES